jgi:hypothetical protein
MAWKLCSLVEDLPLNRSFRGRAACDLCENSVQGVEFLIAEYAVVEVLFLS